MSRRWTLAIFVLLVVSSICRASDIAAIRVAWRMSPSQKISLLAPGSSEEIRPAPVVALKVALPPGAVTSAISIEHLTLTGMAAPARIKPWKGAPVILGARGIWKGVAYQEVLVYPLLAGTQPGQVSFLQSFSASLAITANGAPRCDSLPEGLSFPAQSGLFINEGQARIWYQGSLKLAREFSPESGVPQGLRIQVSQDGIIRMDKAHLPTALTSGDPRDLHLRCRGVEIPIVVEGEGDGSFDPSDAVVFYGQKLSIRDRDIWNGGDFTDTNIYWLTLEGTPGLRMASVEAEPTQGFPTPPSFDTTVHVEQNNFFTTVNHFNPNRDLWYMRPYYGGSPGGSATFAVTLPHAYGSAAQVTAHLLGFANVSHAVHITLNGATPTSGGNPATWSGAGFTMQTWGFTSGLVSGPNSLVLSSDLGDYQIPDYFDVTYGRTFDADSNGLLITDANANAQYVSAGYSGAPYVLDLSQADSTTGLFFPKLVTGASFASGTATFEIAADPSVSSRRVALSSAPLLPDAAEMASGRNLSDPALGADLLIITHPDFHPDGQDQVWLDYLARREAQMQVQVVDIQDVYDNFSDGIMDPTAIRTFLQAAAANWAPVPKYVLLIGDSSWDYKNYLQDPTFKSWVPTMMFEDLGDSTYMGRYPSDAWYADVHGDGFPDMAVGRLPARSYDQFAAMLTKIMAYEDQALSGTWYKTGLFVADTWNESWEQVFETYNSELQATYTTPPWQNLHVYFHDPPYDGVDANACAADIRAAWDQSAIVHYDGHSGIQSWGKSHAIFTAFPSRTCGTGTCSDVDLLAPISLPYGPAPLPFVVNSSCYNSAFDEQSGASLMEALIDRPDGGSIGSCGFSTIAWPDEEEAFNSAIFDQAFLAPKVRTLGDLVEAGRFALPSTDARSVMGNILLGDPTLDLRLPAPPAPVLSASPLDAAVALSWTTPSPAPASYALYRSMDNGQTWAFLTTTGGGTTSTTDSGLQNGMAYAYYVTSIDAEGFEGPPSNIVAATPQGSGLCTLSCQATVPAVTSVGLLVPFIVTITSPPCSESPQFEWDFGDGSPHSSEQYPQHVYGTPSTYFWSLTVTVQGVQCAQSGTITVGEACTLSCKAVVPVAGATGTPVAFDLTITSPPCTETPRFDWDFGDGSPHSTIQSPEHTYLAPGRFSWTLTVAEGSARYVQGGTIVISQGCTLACQVSVPPMAAISLPVAFKLFITSAPCDTAPQFDWDFGDGSPRGTDQNPTHVYTSPGSYDWSVSVAMAGNHFAAAGTIKTTVPISIISVKKSAAPFRIILRGSVFDAGTSIYIDGSPWASRKIKSATKLVIKGGAALRQLFPPDAFIPIRIVNSDGGEVTVLFNRSLNQWRTAS